MRNVFRNLRQNSQNPQKWLHYCNSKVAESKVEVEGGKTYDVTQVCQTKAYV